MTVVKINFSHGQATTSPWISFKDDRWVIHHTMLPKTHGLKLQEELADTITPFASRDDAEKMIIIPMVDRVIDESQDPQAARSKLRTQLNLLRKKDDKTPFFRNLVRLAMTQPHKMRMTESSKDLLNDKTGILWIVANDMFGHLATLDIFYDIDNGPYDDTKLTDQSTLDIPYDEAKEVIDDCYAIIAACERDHPKLQQNTAEWQTYLQEVWQNNIDEPDVKMMIQRMAHTKPQNMVGFSNNNVPYNNYNAIWWYSNLMLGSHWNEYADRSPLKKRPKIKTTPEKMTISPKTVKPPKARFTEQTVKDDEIKTILKKQESDYSTFKVVQRKNRITPKKPVT